MKIVFLRGKVPSDRSPKEIMYTGLDGNDDVWEHVACAIGDQRTDIFYWGGNRLQHYSEKDTVSWVEKPKHYKADFEPNVVFARGGFEDYVPILKRYKHAFKIFYGAGENSLPKDGIKYDLVLVDSEKQLHKANKKGLTARIWVKPAAPMFSKMPEIAKEFDVCFIGDARFPYRAKKKNVNWVYKTVPSDITLLHLGWSGPYKPPVNVTVRRVKRTEMALEYAKCHVGIAPYRSWDSAPRIIPEMAACGLPIIVTDDVHYARGKYPMVIECKLEEIWQNVKSAKSLNSDIPIVGIEESATYIRGLIYEASKGRVV